MTRQEFFDTRQTDAYNRVVWSFGSNQQDYIYGADVEPLARMSHEYWLQTGRYGRHLENNHSQHIERYYRVNNIRINTPVKVLQGSYDDVNIEPDGVIYCDIPYRGTHDYSVSFDYDRFYRWCIRMAETNPIFISEYNMPVPFVSVWEKQHISTLSATNNKTFCVEHLFTLPKYTNLVPQQLKLF